MLQRVFELEREVPAWLRPTYRGALFIFGMGLGAAGKLFTLSILATLILVAGADRGLALFFGLLGAAVVAGAVAGTLHGLLRPVESWGFIGAWLRWALAIFGYVLAFGFLTPQGPFARPDPTFSALAGIISALAAGCVVLLDDRKPGRPSPHRFRLLQSRQRLWAAARRKRAELNARFSAAHRSTNKKTRKRSAEAATR